MVRQRAAQLLKARPEQVERIFSGKAIVLRKDLSEEQVPRYRKSLEQIGMRIYLERMKESNAPSLPPPPPPARPVAPRTPFPQITVSEDFEPTVPPVPSSGIPLSFPPNAARFSRQEKEIDPFYGARPSLIFPSEFPSSFSIMPKDLSLMEDASMGETECPRCGTKQPKRTLCRKCGADIQYLLNEREAGRGLAEQGKGLAALQGVAKRTEGKDFRVIRSDDKTVQHGSRGNMRLLLLGILLLCLLYLFWYGFGSSGAPENAESQEDGQKNAQQNRE